MKSDDLIDRIQIDRGELRKEWAAFCDCGDDAYTTEGLMQDELRFEDWLSQYYPVLTLNESEE